MVPFTLPGNETEDFNGKNNMEGDLLLRWKRGCSGHLGGAYFSHTPVWLYNQFLCENVPLQVPVFLQLNMVLRLIIHKYKVQMHLFFFFLA